MKNEKILEIVNVYVFYMWADTPYHQMAVKFNDTKQLVRSDSALPITSWAWLKYFLFGEGGGK